MKIAASFAFNTYWGFTNLSALKIIHQITRRLGCQEFARFWLAGPITLLVSIVIMASCTLWLPGGRAGIDHLVTPLILFPVIWTVCFMYVVLEEQLNRAAWLLGGLLILNGTIVGLSIAGMLS